MSGYQSPPAPPYAQPYGNGYQQQPPQPQAYTPDYNNYGGSGYSQQVQQPPESQSSTPEDEQERFAPQPGYVPQPHPSINLYYGYGDNAQGYSDSQLLTDQNIDQSMEKPQCRDPCCAIFFIISMLGLVALCGYSAMLKVTNDSTNIWHFDRSSLLLLAVSCIASVVVSAAMLCFIQSNAVCMVWTTLIFNACAWIVIGALSCMLQQYWGAVFIFIGFILLLYPWCLRNRIQFVGIMIKHSATGLKQYPGVFGLALGVGAITVAITVGVAVSMTRIQNHFVSKQEDNLGVCILIGQFFLLYWACEFLRGWLHTVVAGVIGTFWYMPNQLHATGPSMKRASTTSMGSIAFGTLLVSVCNVCRTIARMKFKQLCKARGSGKNAGLLIVLLIIIACIACLFSCFENALRWINHYAFTYVALYGTSYIESGKRVMDSFFQTGFMMIIQKDLTGFVVNVGVLLSTALSAGITFLAFWYGGVFDWKDQADKGEKIAFIITIAVFVGAYTSQMILTPLISAVTSTFVTWSEDGAALEQNHPGAYHEMVDARNKVWM